MKFKAYVKRFMAWVIFVFTGRGEIAREGVDADICDYSGQGRDTYGR